MRRMLLAVAVALALPTAAGSKGPVTAAVCGPDRCESFAVRGFHEQVAVAPSKWASAPPPRSYYRVDLGGEGWSPATAYYEPVSRLFASADGFGLISWSHLGAAGIAEAAKGLRPYPPPQVTAAFVGDQRVSGDAATYLSLLSLDGEFHVPGERARFEQIRLESPGPNPWTEALLLYYPDDRVLFTSSGLYVRVPEEVAAALDGARPLGGEERRVVPWLPAAIALVGALVLLAARRRGGARRLLPAETAAG